MITCNYIGVVSERTVDRMMVVDVHIHTYPWILQKVANGAMALSCWSKFQDMKFLTGPGSVHINLRRRTRDIQHMFANDT